MSHCRKNSVRDKVISKKWIYSDTEISTLHRQECEPLERVNETTKCCVISFYRLGNLTC